MRNNSSFAANKNIISVLQSNRAVQQEAIHTCTMLTHITCIHKTNQNNNKIVRQSNWHLTKFYLLQCLRQLTSCQCLHIVILHLRVNYHFVVENTRYQARGKSTTQEHTMQYWQRNTYRLVLHLYTYPTGRV